MQNQSISNPFTHLWNQARSYLQRVFKKHSLDDTAIVSKQKDHANDTTNFTFQSSIETIDKQQVNKSKQSEQMMILSQKSKSFALVNTSNIPKISIKNYKRQRDFEISPQQSKFKIYSSNEGPLRKFKIKNGNSPRNKSQKIDFSYIQGNQKSQKPTNRYRKILNYDLPEARHFNMNYSRQFFLNLTYKQISYVSDVQISNQYGIVTFLEPINLFRKNIAESIIITSCFYDIFEPEWKNQQIRVCLKNFTLPKLFRDCKKSIEALAEELANSKNMKILYFNKKQSILQMISDDYLK